MRAIDFLSHLNESTLITDVPNEDWLQGKIDYAKSKGRDSYGVPYMTSSTTAVVKPFIRLPVSLLKRLPGMRGEQRNVRQNDLAAIMKIMRDTGKLPLTRSGEEYAPFVVVAYNGEAWVSEGNHRIMAADRLGWDTLPVELRYFDGGERIKSGPLYPGKIGLSEPNVDEGRKKKKRKTKYRMPVYGMYGYYGTSGENTGSDGGGDGGGGESMYESAVRDLVRKLPSLDKHDYNTIDKLMRKVASKHRITANALHDLFVKKYHKTPDSWIKNKLDEDNVECDLEKEVNKFVQWTAKKLNLKKIPKITLSMDTEEAQSGHHTGSHHMGTHEVWVYAKNRNLVDILRTVFHELVHVRQDELGMIKPGDSYPGSPIEAMADMLAGKWIKIYGAENHNIFQ
jgi:hypothetical protein